jgi:hypothetical protein
MFDEYYGPTIRHPVIFCLVLVLLKGFASSAGEQPCGQANQTSHPEDMLAFIRAAPTNGRGSLARPLVCAFGSPCLFEERISGLASGVVYVVKLRYYNNWMGLNKDVTISDEEWTFTAPEGDEYLYKEALNPRPLKVLPVDMYTIEMSLYDGCPYLAASSWEMKQESLLAHSGEIHMTVKLLLLQSTLYRTNCRGIEDCNRLERESMWSQV